MTESTHGETIGETDEPTTHWWTESQIRNVIHTSDSGQTPPGELFVSRPTEQPLRRATVRERKPKGNWHSLINWFRGR